MRNRIKQYQDEDQMAKRSHLFGVGLDNDDGHKRLTRADQFSVVGGSAETHERMTGTMLKTFEDLERRGKRLEDAEPQELSDIISKNTERLG